MLGCVVVTVSVCEVAVVISVSFVLAVLSVVIMDEVMIVVAGVVVGTPEEKTVSPVKSFAVDWFKWIIWNSIYGPKQSHFTIYASFPSVASIENGLMWRSVKLKLFAESYDVQKVPWLAHTSDYSWLYHVIFRWCLDSVQYWSGLTWCDLNLKRSGAWFVIGRVNHPHLSHDG